MSVVTNLLNNSKKFIKQNKDSIRFGLGVGGTIATGITGVRAGMRIERKLQKAREESTEELTRKDILKIAAPELIPVALSMGGSIGFQTVNFISLSNRLSDASAVVAALSGKIEDIKKAEKEVVGEEKAAEIQKKVVEQPKLIDESPSGCFWYKDFYTNAEFYTTEAAIERGIGVVNRYLTFDDVTTNDYALNIDKKDGRDIYSEMGDETGWKCGTILKVRYGDGHLANGTPCRTIIVDHKPTLLPKYALS